MNGTFYKNPTFPGVEEDVSETTNYTENIKDIPEPGINYFFFKLDIIYVYRRN